MSEEKKINNEIDGAFVVSLKRNNKQIREDRAIAISRNGRLKYKRLVEDLEEEIISLQTEQENMLDLSPTNAQSLIVASDFKADEYAKKDLEIGVRIRNLSIKLDVAKNRYNYLFRGGK